MENESLIQQLKTLRAIQPDPVFLRWSRRAILAAQHKPTKYSIFIDTIKRITFPKLVFPLAATSIATFILIITASEIINQPTTEENQIIASLNQEAILKEKHTVAQENKLTEITYYKNVAPAITLALNDITDPKTNWKSGEHIKQIARHYNEK